MKTTKHFALIALIVLGALLGASTPARAGNSQTRWYEIVPVNGGDSGEGLVAITISGPLISEKGFPKYWDRTFDGWLILPPEVGWYYVYFDQEFYAALYLNEFGYVLGFPPPTETFTSKPALPKAIYVFDEEGNLVLYGKGIMQ